MNIHIVGNATRLSEDLSSLRTIAEAVHEHGDIVALNWFEPANGRDVEDKIPPGWPAILDEYVEAASKADLLIIEASGYRFDVGYFLAMATQNKKPTLLVSRNAFEGKSLSGIESQYLTKILYKNDTDLKRIITQFLNDNAIDSNDLRFNFFIDRQIYNYLRDKSYETGKNKSEIIRELLDREINRGKS